jgi:pimeloyl-ACP methyl ester carboxylesterase
MPHVITLIHGTFATNAAWCRPDSPLCNAISSAFGDDVIFAQFVWSGRNSFRDRKEGADNLLQHFRDLRTEYPDSKHLAIAHSHGGNILVNTLQRSPESVDAAICLATPFFIIEPRAEHAFLEMSAYRAAVWRPLYFLILSLGILTYQHTSALSISVRIVISVLLLAVTRLAMRRIVKKLQSWFVSVAAAVSARLLESSTEQIEGCQKILIMRSPRDEAALSLGVLTFANWLLDRVVAVLVLPRAISDWVQPHLHLPPPSMRKMLNIALSVGTLYLLKTPNGRHTLLLMLLALLAASATFSASLLLGPSLLSLGFGVDVFFGAWRTRISIEPTPPGFWQIYTMKADPVDSTMRHSLPYTSGEGSRIIVSWFR